MNKKNTVTKVVLSKGQLLQRTMFSPEGQLLTLRRDHAFWIP